MVLLGLSIAWALPTWREAQAAPSAASGSTERWQAWSPERVAALNAEGRTVFVDFTAAWCVTCQVNKRSTLERRDVDGRDGHGARGAAARRLDAPRRHHQQRAVTPGHATACRCMRSIDRGRRSRRCCPNCSAFQPCATRWRCEPRSRRNEVLVVCIGARRRAGIRRHRHRRPTRAGFQRHRRQRQGRVARRLQRQDRRPRMGQPRLPVRAQALRQRQHAGHAEGRGRQGRGLACRSTPPRKVTTTTRSRPTWRRGCSRKRPPPRTR